MTPTPRAPPLRDPWGRTSTTSTSPKGRRSGGAGRLWLIDLTAEAFARTPDLHTFAGRVSDSGNGRWTVDTAIDEGVPSLVITMAL